MNEESAIVRAKPRVLPVRAIALAALAQAAIGLFIWPHGGPNEAAVRTKPRLPITIIAIDDASLASVGKWPWSRGTHARLLAAAIEAGARSVTFDVIFDTPSKDLAGDAALARIIAHAPVPVALAAAPASNGQPASPPIPLFAEHAKIVAAAAIAGRDGVAGDVPRTMMIAGHAVPSIATELAHGTGRTGIGTTMPVDWSIDRAAIPTVSAAQLLAGKVARGGLTGRDVVIAPVATSLGDAKISPDGNTTPGIFVQILAAEAATRNRQTR